MVDAQVSGRYRGHCRPGTGAASPKCQPGTGVTVSSMNRVRTSSTSTHRAPQPKDKEKAPPKESAL